VQWHVAMALQWLNTNKNINEWKVVVVAVAVSVISGSRCGFKYTY